MITDFLSGLIDSQSLVLLTRSSHCVSHTYPVTLVAQPTSQDECHGCFRRGSNLHLRCNRLPRQGGKQKSSPTGKSYMVGGLHDCRKLRWYVLWYLPTRTDLTRYQLLLLAVFQHLAFFFLLSSPRVNPNTARVRRKLPRASAGRQDHRCMANSSICDHMRPKFRRTEQPQTARIMFT